MSPLEGLAAGFAVALTPENLLACFIGVLLGTIVGMLPGFGPVSGMVVLLPITFTLPTETAIIALAGIYYGSMYGGTITSILMNIPGEAATVVTVLDGRPMALQGRAGVALGIAAIGSFVAGTFGVVALSLLAPALAGVALAFGPAQYFALIVLALVAVGALSDAPLRKGLAATAIGVALATIGIDPISGSNRSTYGLSVLLAGVALVPLVTGLFGIGEILSSRADSDHDTGVIEVKNPYPSRSDLRRAAPSIARGGVLGFFLGLLPGIGAAVSSFISYAVERRISRRKEEFGKGAIEGVAGPESANNAATAGSLVPTFALGLPGSGSTAVLLAALILHGIRPGPLLFEQQPEVVWGVIASMYIGNVLLLVMNLPLAAYFARLLLIPRTILLPIILSLAIVAAWLNANREFDVLLMVVFGALGYYMRVASFPIAPVVLGLVLGGQLEQTFRQAVSIARTDYLTAFADPLSLTIFAITALLLVLPFLWRRFAPQLPATTVEGQPGSAVRDTESRNGGPSRR